jgi:hypothetical protein
LRPADQKHRETIFLGRQRAGGKVVVLVEDEGPGIPKTGALLRGEAAAETNEAIEPALIDEQLNGAERKTCFASVCVQTIGGNMDPRYQALTAVLSDYFDGLYHSDTKRLAKVFHPDARYVCATGGTLLHLDMKEYFAVVDKRPAPASRNEARTDQIVSIEFAGP